METMLHRRHVPKFHLRVSGTASKHQAERNPHQVQPILVAARLVLGPARRSYSLFIVG